MKTCCHLFFLFSMILLMLGSHQAQSQVVLSDETDNYERLESLLSIMPDEFHALFPEINKEAIGRMQNQKKAAIPKYTI